MVTLHVGAMLAAAVASFMIGWLWYSPLMFQTAWMRMAQIPKDTPVGTSMAWTMLLGFATYVVLAGVMDALFQMIGVGTLGVALKVAAMLWLGFVATLTLGMVTWERKPVQLYLINNSYHLVAFLVTAAILIALR